MRNFCLEISIEGRASDAGNARIDSAIAEREDLFRNGLRGFRAVPELAQPPVLRNQRHLGFSDGGFAGRVVALLLGEELLEGGEGMEAQSRRVVVVSFGGERVRWRVRLSESAERVRVQLELVLHFTLIFAA